MKSTKESHKATKAEYAAHSRKHHKSGSENLVDKNIILDTLDIRSGQIVLDAGCGNGYMAKEFSKSAGSYGQVYALDLKSEFIEKLKRDTAGTNIHPIVGDITNTVKIVKETIDLIYLSTVLHGFTGNQLTGFINESKRLLKQNGKLAIVEIEKENTPFGPPATMRFTPEEMNEAIPFHLLKTVKVGEYFYMQIYENN